MFFDITTRGDGHYNGWAVRSYQDPMFVNLLRRWFIVVALSTLGFAPRVTAQESFEFFEPVEPPRAIKVMVHRGMAMASPENSAAAIQMCIEDFCEWVEIDVRLTKDGRHVIIHNEAVDSTTNGKGIVEDLTVAELQSLDAGSWFARRFEGTRLLTLPQALALAKGKINLYLDCKQIDPKLLVEDLKSANRPSSLGRELRTAIKGDCFEKQ